MRTIIEIVTEWDLRDIFRTARAFLAYIGAQRQPEKPDSRTVIGTVPGYRLPVNFVAIGRPPMLIVVPVSMN